MKLSRVLLKVLVVFGTLVLANFSLAGEISCSSNDKENVETLQSLVDANQSCSVVKKFLLNCSLSNQNTVDSAAITINHCTKNTKLTDEDKKALIYLQKRCAEAVPEESRRSTMYRVGYYICMLDAISFFSQLEEISVE